MERYLNGSWLATEETRRCETCVNQTAPIVGGAYRCDVCGQTLSVQRSDGCECADDRLVSHVTFDEILQKHVPPPFCTSTCIIMVSS